MTTKILNAGSRTVSRHPGKTLRVSLLAIRHRRAILVMTKATRRVTQVGSTVKRVAADPKVQSEASSAVSSLMLAGKRARRVGVAKAPNDKQVAAQLRRAGLHASRAMAATRHPRRKQRVVRTTTIVTGAGALTGVAYAGWRAYGRPVHPAERQLEATGTPDALAADPDLLETPGKTATTPISDTNETDGHLE